MKTSVPRFPDLTRNSFARTNKQTIGQRVELLRELIPGVRSIAEICCGDCSRQHRAYTSELGVQSFQGLDLEPAIIAANRAKGIECRQGDALSMPNAYRLVGITTISLLFSIVEMRLP